MDYHEIRFTVFGFSGLLKRKWDSKCTDLKLYLEKRVLHNIIDLTIFSLILEDLKFILLRISFFTTCEYELMAV